MMNWISWFKQNSSKKIIIVSFISLVVFGFALFLISRETQKKSNLTKQEIRAKIKPTLTITFSPTKILNSTNTITPSPKVFPTNLPPSKILFGIGSQAGPAMDYRIVKESPVYMLTSWYNGTKDLEWMQV